MAGYVPAVDIRDNGEMFVALLREFARRTAQEHRESLQPVRIGWGAFSGSKRGIMMVLRRTVKQGVAKAERHDVRPENYHQRQPPLLREREVFF